MWFKKTISVSSVDLLVILIIHHLLVLFVFMFRSMTDCIQPFNYVIQHSNVV
jgi:hypothetical protein